MEAKSRGIIGAIVCYRSDYDGIDVKQLCQSANIPRPVES
jgi:hypothetical protein